MTWMTENLQRQEKDASSMEIIYVTDPAEVCKDKLKRSDKFLL